MNVEGFWLYLMIAGVGAFVVALAGGLLTEIGPWYYALKKPAWKPPDWSFGPIWTVILAMAALAAALAYDAAPQGEARRWIVVALCVNALLHFLWSPIFFKWQRPDLALIEVVFLWLSVLSLILVLGSHSRTAMLLLLPYIVWVTIAAFLNYEIVRLNRPFV